LFIFLDVDEVLGANTDGVKLTDDERAPKEDKPKIVQKKRRKTNIEKSLDAVFNKFHDSSNTEFLRYIYNHIYNEWIYLSVVDLISSQRGVSGRTTHSASDIFWYFNMPQVSTTWRRKIQEGNKIEFNKNSTKEGRKGTWDEHDAVIVRFSDFNDKYHAYFPIS